MTNLVNATGAAKPNESLLSDRRLTRGIGYGLSTLVVLFLLMDAVMKLMAMGVVMQAMGELGWPHSEGLARGLGLLLLICTLLYCFPRTSVLGAVLLTAFLGGAVATHVRAGTPLFTHQLFGVYLGLFVWAGLYLREPRLRALFPLRTIV